jgi:hypothetical protein
MRTKNNKNGGTHRVKRPGGFFVKFGRELKKAITHSEDLLVKALVIVITVVVYLIHDLLGHLKW